MANTPTLKIKYPANPAVGYALINESDFDPQVHELFDAHDAGDTPDGTPIPIPADWETLHHNKQIALAKELIAGDVVPTEGRTMTEMARAIIAATVADRANPPIV